MRIVVDPEELSDLHKKMKRAGRDIERMGNMLEGVWRSVDYEGSQRGSLDATWAEMAALFTQLVQQYEEMSAFLNKKSGDFAEADGQESGFKAGTLLKWTAIVLGTTLDFVPVVGNVKGVVDAALGYDVFTGEKLSRTERTLGILGPAGKVLKHGSKAIGLIDDVSGIGKQGDRVSDVHKAVEGAEQTADAAKHADAATGTAGTAAKHGDQAADAAKHGDEAAEVGKRSDEAAGSAKQGDEAPAASTAKHSDEAAAASETADQAAIAAAVGTGGGAAAVGAISGKAGAPHVAKKDRIHPNSKAADPVDTSTGAQVIEHPLLYLRGAEEIAFTLQYNSLLSGKGALGYDWSHNFETRLDIKDHEIELWWNSFRHNTYIADESGIYRSTDLDMLQDRIIPVEGGYQLVRGDHRILFFNPEGRLQQIESATGQTQSLFYDEQDRLMEVKDDLTGRTFTFTYNDAGLLHAVTDPLGLAARFDYAEGRLLTIYPPDDSHIGCKYTTEGRLSSIRSSEGITYFVNEYDAEGRVIRQNDALGNIFTFQYDEQTRPGYIITTFTDREGASRVFTHNNRYRLVELQNELGHITRYDYNEQGLCIHEFRADGSQIDYAYDEEGRLLEKRLNKQVESRYAYNEQGLLMSYIDGEGHTISFQYDEHHRPVQREDADGGITRISYNERGLMESMTDPSGAVTKYAYDAFGNLIEVTDPLGFVTRYEYDAGGRITAVIDPSGGVTARTYNVSHQVTSVKDPLGAVTTWTYDTEGRLKRQTDPLGHVTSYLYNAMGDIAEERDAMGRITRYRYDHEERLIQVTLPNGASTHYAYDAAGQLVQITDPAGVITCYVYDAAGRVIQVTDHEGNPLRKIEYDKDGNPAAISNALGHTTKYRFNRLGQIIEEQNAKGDLKQYAYDALSRLVRVHEQGHESSRAFNAAGQLSGYRDPSGNETQFTYDLNGRLTKELTPAGTTLAYAYDPRGFLVQSENARGQTTNYTPDALGRLHIQEDEAGVIERAYDASGRLLTVTERSHAGGRAQTRKRSYDPLGRVTSYTNERGKTLRYEYDWLGNLAVLHYPDGKKVSYRYDAAGRMTEVRDWKGRVTSYTYDSRGQLVRTERPNGTVEQRVYDQEGQLISLLDTGAKGENLQLFRFTYNSLGQLVKENETRFEYNAWGALVAANRRKFKYDPSGNMTESTAGDDLLQMVYGADNRLHRVNGEEVAMDEDGNLLSGPLRGRKQTFTYDARNRLIQAGSIQYGYDAENERSWMTLNGETRRYVVNPHAEYSQLLMETDESGNLTAAYVYGLGLIGREDADGSYQTYHYDLRGSTTLLSDEKGQITDRYSYGAFGELLRHDGKSCQPFAYNGRDGVHTDPNGLYYMRARYYHPELKRFLNRDILRGDITSGLSMNRYAYVNGNPITFVDPLGLDAIQAGKVGGTRGECNYVLYNKTHKDSMPRPKGTGPNGGRLQSHHGLQQEWAKQNLSQYGYNPSLAPTVTLETGKGLPHTTISNAQNARRDSRVNSGQGKWSSSLQDELQYIIDDFKAAGFSRNTIDNVLEQQYKMLDKIKVPYERIKYK
ncbi:RHS repeat-associated core domain-containing protein [Paenibacillus faecalis]|uniref:RHS repeat-associated core domain-containing protein n=1 Tax=Paenibacillus faecalis TaxID=2079532 RepID=UPI000D0FF356|nr:RHS repeat-associated core domain-containing protein [Paenibacillus faecalis]